MLSFKIRIESIEHTLNCCVQTRIVRALVFLRDITKSNGHVNAEQGGTRPEVNKLLCLYLPVFQCKPALVRSTRGCFFNASSEHCTRLRARWARRVGDLIPPRLLRRPVICFRPQSMATNVTKSRVGLRSTTHGVALLCVLFNPRFFTRQD